MTSRAGIEAEAVARLTGGVEPPESRAILVQCLSGELSPGVAIVRLLALSRDVAGVRAALDHVTKSAATRSRAGDNLVHDRADSLTQLFVDNLRECEEIVAMAESDAHARPELLAMSGSYWDAYSHHLRQHPPG
jgi:hypothetical protein